MRPEYSLELVSFLLSNAAAETPGTFTAAGEMIIPSFYCAAILLLNQQRPDRQDSRRNGGVLQRNRGAARPYILPTPAAAEEPG